MKNIHEQTSNNLRQMRKQLISDFIEKQDAYHTRDPETSSPDSQTLNWEQESNFLEQNTRLLDNYFLEGFEKSEVGLRMGFNKKPYAIIALGGYGREEQCVHSDVDILFLFEKAVPDEAETLIQEILYPLWDSGLDVGHATRSVKECVKIAGQNIEVLTSLLDARFICGMSSLYSNMMEDLRKKVISRRSDEFVKLLVERNQQRHLHFGDCAYLLEPNLKEGRGGLRDYHTILWIARIKAGIKQPRDLEYYGCFSHEEFRRLTDSLFFIWYVRNRLHRIVGRKYDQLHFGHQEELAQAIDFRKDNGQQPVEIFLGKLHEKMEFIKHQHTMFLYDLGLITRQKRGRKSLKETEISGLEVKKGMLNFASSKDIPDSPELMIKIFEESARLKLPLSAEARRLVEDFLHLADKKFRNSASVVRSFEQILIEPAPNFNVLNEMLNTGFLVKFIPEFKCIVNRIQYDEYHVYPVDKHSLHTVRTIKKFGTPDDPTKDGFCGDLYKELPDKRLLLWAGLLHDIGKGEPGGGHSLKGGKIVADILAEKGYKPEEIETVSFLVREHLLLMKTATRRDVHDEETAMFCARRIKDADHLKMLCLLTVADAISTGAKAWNDWMSSLLTSLFLSILNVLEKGEFATTEAVGVVEKKKKEVLDTVSKPPEGLQTFFNVMSPRYLLYTPTPDILEHIGLYRKIGSAGFVWKITKSPDLDMRTVTICAKDAPGLFSKISGVFTLNSIDILNAQIYTWKNNIALDIFEVKPPPDQLFEDEKWERAAENLRSALSGGLVLSEALAEKIAGYGLIRPCISERPHRITVDNKSSSFFTIIEVFTYDFPGLLFRITDALFNCGLDVRVAKIATKIDQVVDVFYVRDFNGEKVDSKQESTIRAAIEKVLPTLNFPILV
ncbi:[protein-PII] uridylyltransferase [Desulfobacterales bacterium HSG2]|nr:[protein-PII] uridylyltransferase [Desulfobacterales bacterium HSG2]